MLVLTSQSDKFGYFGPFDKNRAQPKTRQKGEIFSMMHVVSHRIYLLLAEFSVRTVNYEPSFFPSICGLSAKRAGHKSMGKNEDP